MSFRWAFAVILNELTGGNVRGHGGAEIGAVGSGLGAVPTAPRGEKVVAAVGESRVSSEHVGAVRAKGKHARWCCPCGNVVGVLGMGFEVAARRVRPPLSTLGPEGHFRPNATVMYHLHNKNIVHATAETSEQSIKSP